MVPGEDLMEVVERGLLEEVDVVEAEVAFNELVGDGACVRVLEVCEIVVVKLELEVEVEDLFLVVVSLFDRLGEVTGLILDEDVIEVVLKEVVTVLGVRDGACNKLEVSGVAELALLSLLDRLRKDEDVIEVKVLEEVRLVKVEVAVPGDWDNGACILVWLEVSEAAVVVGIGLTSLLDGF